MPNRIIRESIRESYSIDALTPQAEVLFYRLITYADDFGYFKCDPRLVNKALFPLKEYTTDMISGWLDEIAENEMILFYAGSDGKPYGFFINWSEYQKIRNNKPKYPAPESNCEQMKSIDTLMNSIKNKRLQLNTNENNCGQLNSNENNCTQMKANVPVIQSNPIQSESNPKALFNKLNKAPVTGGHFSDQVGSYAEPIIRNRREILKLPQKHKGQRFNPFQWVQFQTNEKKHPGAILETVEALANPKYWNGIRGGPWEYATKIIKTKNGNWNERDHIAESKKFKQIWISPEIQKLIKDIGS